MTMSGTRRRYRLLPSPTGQNASHAIQELLHRACICVVLWLVVGFADVAHFAAIQCRQDYPIHRACKRQWIALCICENWTAKTASFLGSPPPYASPDSASLPLKYVRAFVAEAIPIVFVEQPKTSSALPSPDSICSAIREYDLNL